MFFRKKNKDEISKEQIENLESIGIKYVKRKEKPDIITGMSDEADIIIQTKSSKWKNLLVLIPIILITVPSIFIFIVLNQNNIVTENVIGSSYNFNGMSLVPKSYRVNTKELSSGVEILYKNKTEEGYSKTGFGPIIFKYETAVITRVIDDWWVYISTENSRETIKISTDRIIYIKDPRLE